MEPRERGRRVTVVAIVLALVEVVTLVAGCLSRPGAGVIPLHLGWAFSPVSDTVTIRVTSPAGTTGRRVLAQSQLAVSERVGGHTGRWSAGGGTIRVPVPAGGRISLLVRLTGPQPLTRTVMVTTPPPLRVVSSGASSGRWLVYTSGPLRPGPAQLLCGTDKVSFVASSQVAVAESAKACPARLRLTGWDGEQLVVPVTIPARSTVKVATGSAGRRAR